MHHFEPWKSIPYTSIVRGWWSGVDGFFVLSGILIGGLWFREKYSFGNVELLRFWVRRWFRTIPPYLVAIHFAWIVLVVMGVQGERSAYNWKYLFFLQNYTGITFMGLTWSLCIEEHFYLFLPLLLPFLSKNKLFFHSISFLLFLFPLFVRILTVEDGLSAFGPHYYQTHTHIGGLVLGVWLAYVLQKEIIIHQYLDKISNILLVPSIIFIFFYQNLGISLDWTNKYSYTILALAFASIAWFLLRGCEFSIGKSRFLKLISNSSYSIYLTHSMFIQLMSLIVMKYIYPIYETKNIYFSIIYIITLFVLVIFVGWLFSALFEKTSINLRDKFMPRRS